MAQFTGVSAIILGLALAGPALAATTGGEGQYVVRDALGSLLASDRDATNIRDLFREVNYFPQAGVSDYAFSRGLGGDRYARAGSAAGVETPNLFHQGLGTGLWRNTAVAAGTGIVDITALFRGTATFRDPLSLADRRVYNCTGSIDCSTYADTDFDFSLSARATFGFSVEDSVTGDKWFLLADFGILREVIRADDGNGDFDRFAQDLSQATWTAYLAPGGSGFQLLDSGFVPVPIQRNGAIYSISPVLDIAIAVPFVAGRSYNLGLLVTCTSEAAALAQYMSSGQEGLSSCEATNSGYLTGFENFRDANGNPIAPFALTASDGTNLALASPFAPGGGGGGVIPEPATWALMIAGFGLVGSAVRRQRAGTARA